MSRRDPEKQQPSSSQPPSGRPWWSTSGSDWKSPWSMDDDVPDASPSRPAPAEQPRSDVPRRRRYVDHAAFQQPRPAARQKPSITARPAPPQQDTNIKEQTDTPPPRQHPNLPRRQLRPGFVLFALGAFAFTLAAWVYLHDDPTPWDDDLQLVRTEEASMVVTAPDRLRSLLTAVVPVTSVDHAGRPPWTWDTPTLARFVSANATALNNLRDLLEDYDWHPHHAAWDATDLGSHPSWVHVGMLLQAQAAYLARRGEDESAFVAVIDLAELARRLQDLWSWPTYYERSLELNERCTQLAAELLKENRLSGERLRLFQDEFLACIPSDENLREGFNGFYQYEKRLLFSVLSGIPVAGPGSTGMTAQRPGRLFFKPHQTLQLFARSFRDLKDEFARAPFALAEQIAARLSPQKPRIYLPNWSGESYFTERIQPYIALPARQSLARTRHWIVVCLFAIRCYAADHGGGPPTLADLRPRYLLDIPVDPYSGESLSYDATRGLIFSVGTDLQGTGGSAMEVPLADPTEPTVQTRLSKIGAPTLPKAVPITKKPAAK